jgi:hypothetical protein
VHRRSSVLRDRTHQRIAPARTVGRRDGRRHAAAPNTENDEFAFTLRSLPAGSHVLTLKATDTAGMTATSYPTTVSVEAVNRRPTIALSGPINGQRFVQPAAIGLTSSAADIDGTIAKVEYLADNMLVATSTVAPFSGTWPGAAAGTHSIVARATDSQGAVSVSAPVQIEVAIAAVPPLVALTSPRSAVR